MDHGLATSRRAAERRIAAQSQKLMVYGGELVAYSGELVVN